MADIFISYTSADSEWAKWIAQELEKLGHLPHVHEWEISGGGNIMAWMEERHQKADHILCVISKAYLEAPYSSWERQAAQWAAASKRPNFALPVFVEDVEASTLFAITKRCDLHGAGAEDARARLTNFMTPAAKPTTPVVFPGAAKAVASAAPQASAHAPRPITDFPGKPHALSNIPIVVPLHFLGREDELKGIGAALGRGDGRVAITALHGLRGVGKTTLAAAYAERNDADYRATWWIRAQTEPTMRADLVALGVRLGWIGDEKEEEALAVVLGRLRQEGDGILLIFDNAIDEKSIGPYLPRGGAARVIVTSNSDVWRRIAAPVEIEVWPKETGADYLTARTGRENEREAALILSEALGGLPLAHEQAAAYCERLRVSLAEYRNRFVATPASLLDDTRDAARDYHDGMTVAKTFALAIDEAAKQHPAAEPLVVHAALLAAEPIPLFLFAEARAEFGEPFASALAGDGLDEAVAALRAFALIDRESIADERDPAITTDCIRLHRLVREVAAGRREDEAREGARRVLIRAIAAVYPEEIHNNPRTWPRARRLDAIALALTAEDAVPPEEVQDLVEYLLSGLAAYRRNVLATYPEARPLYERALVIRERVSGPEHPRTATCLNNLALLLKQEGNLVAARPLYERALAIDEKVNGAEHPDTATSLNNLAGLLRDQGDLAAARPLLERALAIREKVSGSEHPATATSLNNFAVVVEVQDGRGAARPLYERALAISEKALGPEHPDVATRLINLSDLLLSEGASAAALLMFQRALAIREKVFGPKHPSTGNAARHAARALVALGRADDAKALRDKYGL